MIVAAEKGGLKHADLHRDSPRPSKSFASSKLSNHAAMSSR